MNDLISRKAAIDIVDAVWSVTGDVNVAKVWDQIKDLPAVDAVPVVRCEDCTFFDGGDSELSEWCDAWGYHTKKDSFCSYAIRRK